LDVEGIGEATSPWWEEEEMGVAEDDGDEAVVPFGTLRELLGAARVK
jgi:hypothetical protein